MKKINYSPLCRLTFKLLTAQDSGVSRKIYNLYHNTTFPKLKRN